VTSVEYRRISDILLRFRNGERDAFSSLFSMYEKKIYFFCCKLLKSKSQASGVAVDVFNYAYVHLTSFSEPMSFEKWLYQVAQNRCYNKINAIHPLDFSDYMDSESSEGNNIEDLIADDMDEMARNPAGVKVDSPMMKNVDKMLSDMPLQLRAAILEKFFCGFETGEIASMEKITVAAARNRIYKARLRLITEEQKYIQAGYNVKGVHIYLPMILNTMAESIVVNPSIALSVTNSTGVTCISSADRDSGAIRSDAEQNDPRNVSAYATDDPDQKQGMTPGVKALIVVVSVLIIAAAIIAIVFAVKGGFSGGGSVETSDAITTTTQKMEITTKPETTKEITTEQTTEAATETTAETTTAATTESTTETTTETTTQATTQQTTAAQQEPGGDTPDNQENAGD